MSRKGIFKTIGYLIQVTSGDLTVARCFVCQKTFKLSTEGKSAVSSHGDGEAHRKLLRNRACFFWEPGEQTSRIIK